VEVVEVEVEVEKEEEQGIANMGGYLAAGW
jgi:hypothetical protein